MKLKKNDNVKVMVGKDRGKTGKLLHINTQSHTVLVEGVTQKRHQRAKKQGEKGEVVSVPRPIQISNVAIVCPNCDKVTRPGARFEGDKKVRICKKCGGVI
ncbi:MAG: 50S ribosomal protein L24 [bacterium]|nr:50S ribosomal protein L24 [bacterium]